MTAMEQHLPGVLDELARDAPQDADLVGRVQAGARRRRLLTSGPIAALLAVAVALGGIWISRPGSGTTAPATPASSCHPLDVGPLPAWARAGFSQPEGNPFALGAKGAMAAIVFANPLLSPPAPERGNKILWVPEQTPSPTDVLTITGHLEGSNLTRVVSIGTAPGPSYVDMPAAGCWQLDLAWGEHTDTVALRWEAG